MLLELLRNPQKTSEQTALRSSAMVARGLLSHIVAIEPNPSHLVKLTYFFGEQMSLPHRGPKEERLCLPATCRLCSQQTGRR